MLDLASLALVRTTAKKVNSYAETLDVLINNAANYGWTCTPPLPPFPETQPYKHSTTSPCPRTTLSTHHASWDARIESLQHGLDRAPRIRADSRPVRPTVASEQRSARARPIRPKLPFWKSSWRGGIRGLLEAREKGELAGELELQSSLGTHLFALAALTYLHVTVSGSYPWLPQIRANVARTMAALVALPPELLIHVSCPFAVTRCMVLTKNRDVLREVVAKAARQGVTTDTIWKGIVLVEECWRLRGEDVGAEVCWVHAMKSLGKKVLLC